LRGAVDPAGGGNRAAVVTPGAQRTIEGPQAAGRHALRDEIGAVVVGRGPVCRIGAQGKLEAELTFYGLRPNVDDERSNGHAQADLRGEQRHSEAKAERDQQENLAGIVLLDVIDHPGDNCKSQDEAQRDEQDGRGQYPDHRGQAGRLS